ncbi:MAG: J domain-containing protein, partial [Myxococcales bacterium]|nr:J domain-containing protein [Myxococcales bacterium]
MAGLDEARARTVLADMQDQLARDPSAALGVPASATAEDVRSAFLELTKQFHPVRFGRMAVDVQKMANEVFLSLRAAHDALAKALRRHSGPIPRPPSLTPGQPTPVAIPATGTGRTTQTLP